MTERLTIYDPPGALVDDEEIAFFMADAFETGDAAYIAKALGIVARSREDRGNANEAATYNECLASEIQAAVDDSRPNVSHNVVMVQTQQETAAHDAWFHRQVQSGLDSASAGDLISAEKVEAEATAWREQTRPGTDYKAEQDVAPFDEFVELESEEEDWD